MPEVSKTVSQALRVLTALGDGGATTAELTRQLGLHRTVVQRLLMTLQAGGFVHRRTDGDFVLGVALVELAARVEHPVRQAAQRPMLSLFETLMAHAGPRSDRQGSFAPRAVARAAAPADLYAGARANT